MFLISFTGAHILAIVLAAIAMQVVGVLWYSPVLGFGKRWMSLVGLSEQMTSTPDFKKQAIKLYGIGFVLSIVISVGLATLMNVFILFSLFDAIKLALLVSVFISTATMAVNYLYNPRLTMRLFVIDAGYHVVALVASSVVLFIMM